MLTQLGRWAKRNILAKPCGCPKSSLGLGVLRILLWVSHLFFPPSFFETRLSATVSVGSGFARVERLQDDEEFLADLQELDELTAHLARRGGAVAEWDGMYFNLLICLISHHFTVLVWVPS